MTHPTPSLAEGTRVHVAIPRQVRWLAAAVLVVTTALTLTAADSRSEIFVVMIGIVASLAGVYGLLLPRRLAQPRTGRTALVLSIVAAVLLLPAFWSGQSLILGAAGALLGQAGRQAPTGARRSTAAIVIGVVASIGYVAVYAFDAVAPPGG